MTSCSYPHISKVEAPLKLEKLYKIALFTSTKKFHRFEQVLSLLFKDMDDFVIMVRYFVQSNLLNYKGIHFDYEKKQRLKEVFHA